VHVGGDTTPTAPTVVVGVHISIAWERAVQTHAYVVQVGPMR
jgi:hypothetical protein